ncbi:MAG: hypothetical protein Q7T21_13575, partial [Gallionella sp.]|nr:hypothetical protein [Gallionella sp.]
MPAEPSTGWHQRNATKRHPAFMLFNSFVFIGIFLPVTLALWWLLKLTVGMRFALAWLVLASLFFYAAWDVRYLSV